MHILWVLILECLYRNYTNYYLLSSAFLALLEIEQHIGYI